VPCYHYQEPLRTSAALSHKKKNINELRDSLERLPAHVLLNFTAILQKVRSHNSLYIITQQTRFMQAMGFLCVTFRWVGTLQNTHSHLCGATFLSMSQTVRKREYFNTHFFIMHVVTQSTFKYLITFWFVTPTNWQSLQKTIQIVCKRLIFFKFMIFLCKE